MRREAGLYLDDGFVFAGSNVDVAHEQGYLVVRVQVVPEHIGEFFHIVRNSNQLGLALKAGERIAIVHVGMNEMALACRAVLVGEGVAVAA